MFYNYYSDIMELKNIDIWLTNFLMSIGVWGYILSCILIILEAVIPVLPLSVFITLLFYKFGWLLGFIISYMLTIIGCLISYNIFNSKFRSKYEKYINKNNRKKLKELSNKLKIIKFETLSLIIALPFTPAFLINIGAGLTNMYKKKYIYAVLIGKLFLVIFWGFIGTSIINSIKNPTNLIYIIIMLLLCFLISKFVNKKEGIE